MSSDLVLVLFVASCVEYLEVAYVDFKILYESSYRSGPFRMMIMR